jgi:hypothetical protein
MTSENGTCKMVNARTLAKARRRAEGKSASPGRTADVSGVHEQFLESMKSAGHEAAPNV